MAVIDINWNPSHKELRWFAGLLIIFFGMVAGWLYWKYAWPTAALIIFGVAAVVGGIGLVAPAMMRPVYIGWIVAAFPIGWTISHLVLAVVFYLVVTPIGLMMRLCGRDPVHRRFDRTAKSYWLLRTERAGTDHYFKQF